MAIFGLGTKDQLVAKKEQSKKEDKAQAKPATEGNTSQADEAKAMLAKMEAKKEAGDCPFC